jgi:hypothetical protein
MLTNSTELHTAEAISFLQGADERQQGPVFFQEEHSRTDPRQ